MAEAKLPPFIAAISGKLGDGVYRVSKNGKTFASKVPKSPRKNQQGTAKIAGTPHTGQPVRKPGKG